ncbi:MULTISPECIES: hypothetical protein [Cupriavidus]|uniref:PHA-granule associated protein 4 n=1 Tax=Cupriavidus pinatubonensis (strain JMP 134 / LMG 1197) TaxID=264198 RepID=Q46P53_CUPPJ|nr:MULTISPECIES: hypothetical protein [Cupriavidus]QYY29529.1 PHA-granule associated protein 4 [Cupriavidus pinatubonensis]TPQ40506.1 PHA-granule associated protein 4 [Cupriavidus pinatubonensis]
MSTFTARDRASAVERIHGRAAGTLELDYENAWQDAVELEQLGRQFGVDVQYRAVEHVSVASPEALVRGLRMEKATFRQRYLYCRFDMAALSEDTLRDLEDLAIEHGDYLMPANLFTEATLTWM